MDLYLTGSRFFGGFREDSDYDYMGQYTPDNLKELLERGFKVGSVCLFSKDHSEDIFLVNDIDRFVKARDHLLKLPLSDHPKFKHGYLWMKALEITGGK